VRAARRGHRCAVLTDGHRARRGGGAVLRRPHARRDRWRRRALAGPRRGVRATADRALDRAAHGAASAA
jgi:hypothetical protein